MTTLREKMVEILVRDFGLEMILEQNDITEEDVVEILVEGGLIDLEEYFFSDAELCGEDDE